MANSYISEKLKAARIASGLKQREVYEWLGVGQSTFSAWETGASEPSIGVFLRLCQKYGIQDIYAYFMPDSPLQGLWKDLDPSFLNRLLALPPPLLSPQVHMRGFYWLLHPLLAAREHMLP